MRLIDWIDREAVQSNLHVARSPGAIWVTRGEKFDCTTWRRNGAHPELNKERYGWIVRDSSKLQLLGD